MMKFKHIAYHREAVMGMNIKKVSIVILLCMMCIPGVFADYSELIEYDLTGVASWSQGTAGTSSATQLYVSYLIFPHIEDFKHVTSLVYTPDGTYDFGWYDSLGTTTDGATAKVFTVNEPGVLYATGTAYIRNSGGAEYMEFIFDTWTVSGTGEVFKQLTFPGAYNYLYIKKVGSDVRYTPGATGITEPYFGGQSRRCLVGLHQTSFSTSYKANLSITSVESGGVVLSNITSNRNIGGIDYPSWIKVTEGEFIYLNDVYEISGQTTVDVASYPVDVLISFGYPTKAYTRKVTYYATGDYIDEENPVITPTPTPVPELCGYWSLAVNTSQVNMSEYVQGTLTETDPSDRYDMIDWYRVMPSGQEVLALHYVYDPGLFGLGAGWFEVTPTGTPYASSLAQAMQNNISFTTAGANHLRAKIYDDKSILPMVYHDYDLVCTLDQVVYVGGTTQASNTLGINVKECDTNALLTGVSIGVYDYLTGQWINKTSEYGGTTYFNVVPGHNVRVVANKTGWLNSDTDYTIPATPYPYEVCLKRPLVDIEDKSYVFFNVRDSVTLTGLFQANIQLSDGQIQNTLPSGYAGFSVNDSETYIYTVTKPGYQSFSDSFTITTDTTIPVKLVQISPTPTLTYPVTTLPTVTITGTGTVTPTGTGTGVWSNTTATLSPTDKTYKTTKGLDIWYMNLETLSGLLFVAAVFGAIGLISDSMSRRRRR